MSITFITVTELVLVTLGFKGLKVSKYPHVFLTKRLSFLSLVWYPYFLSVALGLVCRNL